MPTHWCASALASNRKDLPPEQSGTVCPKHRTECTQKLLFRFTLSGQDSQQRFQGNSPWPLSISAQVKEQDPEATCHLYSLPQLECHMGNLKLVCTAQLSYCCQYRPQWENCPQKHNQHSYSRPKTWNIFIYLKIEWPATCTCKENSDILKLKEKI